MVFQNVQWVGLAEKSKGNDILEKGKACAVASSGEIAYSKKQK